MTTYGAKLSNAEMADSEFAFSVSSTLATGPIPVRWVAPYAITITYVRAIVNTPSAGASIIVDLLRATNAAPNTFTTLYTTSGNRPTISAAAYVGTTTLPNTVSIAAGDFLRMQVIQIGNTTAGSDLTLQIGYTRT